MFEALAGGLQKGEPRGIVKHVDSLADGGMPAQIELAHGIDKEHLQRHSAYGSPPITECPATPATQKYKPRRSGVADDT